MWSANNIGSIDRETIWGKEDVKKSMKIYKYPRDSKRE